MFGLTDQALQLIVGSIILTASIAGLKAENEDLLTTATAQYMTAVQQADNTYVTNNLQTLGTLSAYAGTGVAPPTNMTTTVNGANYTTTVNNPLSPTVNDLINLKLLPVGFGTVSPMGQGFTTYLTPVNCPGSACMVQGTMRTNAAYKDKSGQVRSDMVADVVAHAGNDAGASYSEKPGTVYGFRRTWQMANPVGSTPAMLMMRVGSSSNAPCTIFTCYTRAGLYPLTAALQGGGQDAINLRNVTASGTVTAAVGAFNAGNGVTIGSSAYYGDTQNSAVRQDGTLYVQNRAGTAAAPINTGNASITGNASVSGFVQIVGNAVQGQSCPTDAAIVRNAASWSSLLLCSYGRWQPIGTANNNAAPGAWCGPAGAFYTDVNNNGYICNYEGYMTPLAQTLSNFSTVYKTLVHDTYPNVGKPSCPGGTPVVDIIPQTTGVNDTVGPPYESVVYRMNDAGSYWVPQITLIQAGTGAGESGNDLGLTATAVVQCQYSNGAAPGY